MELYASQVIDLERGYRYENGQLSLDIIGFIYRGSVSHNNQTKNFANDPLYFTYWTGSDALGGFNTNNPALPILVAPQQSDVFLGTVSVAELQRALENNICRPITVAEFKRGQICREFGLNTMMLSPQDASHCHQDQKDPIKVQ